MPVLKRGIPREEFKKLIREHGPMRASLSHEQHKPHISEYAIVDWFLGTDGELWSHAGGSIKAALDMPAYHLYVEDYIYEAAREDVAGD